MEIAAARPRGVIETFVPLQLAAVIHSANLSPPRAWGINEVTP
jgi:hypothetical protein